MADTIHIKNISNYNIEFRDDSLFLTPKTTLITEDELITTKLSNSKIINNMIKDGDICISNNTQYRPILIDIWSNMPTQKILQNTLFNFKLANTNGELGYNWDDKINMSFQNKNANGCIKEIINMCRINDYSIDILIKLENNNNINFKLS